MKNKATATLLVGIALLVALTLLWPLSGCGQPTAAPEKTALPKLISISTYEVGSNGYLESSGMRAAVEQSTPMLLRIEPYDSDLTRMAPLRNGKTEFINCTSVTAYWVTQGIEQFKDWGPTPLRRVWKGKPYLAGMFTRGDSGFKTIADLKGKGLPQGAFSLGWSLNIQAALAFGGLTLQDVKVVSPASMTAGVKGVLEGTMDASLSPPWMTPVQELAAII